MGDKSPKSTKKKVGQKQSKQTDARDKKKAADDAKHFIAPPKKK